MEQHSVAHAGNGLGDAGRIAVERTAAEATLERTRASLEALAETADELESLLPGRVEAAVREGLRIEALPVARQLAEVRGLAAQLIRRSERLEIELLAERYARVDDLALLVDLITAGWRSVDERLARIEAGLHAPAR
jgi:hypothetical protein